MRNKDNAKLFRDAIQSPIGSTSRAKAQKIFSIMNKLQDAHQQDGMGGPGIMMERYEQSTPLETTDQPQSMVIFHKLPPMDVNYDGVARAPKVQNKGTANDGAGGPGVADGMGGPGDWLSSALSVFGSSADTSTPFATLPMTNDGALIPPNNPSVGASAFQAPSAATTNFLNQTPTPPSNSSSLASGMSIGADGKVYTTGANGIATPVGGYPAAPATPGLSSSSAGHPSNSTTMNTTPGVTSAFTMPPNPGFNPGNLAIDASGTAWFNGSPVGNPNNTTVASLLMGQGVPAGGPTYVPPAPSSVFATQPQAPAFPPMSQSNQQLGPTNPNSGVSGISGGPGQTNTNSGQSGSQSGAGSAAINYSNTLGVDPTSSLAAVVNTKGMQAVVSAIVANEGGSPQGVNNNPGNIKFAGLPGQTDSGVQATDGGTFASYSSPQAGAQAVADIVTGAMSGTGVYGANPTLQSFANTYTNTGAGASGSSTGTTGGVAGTSTDTGNTSGATPGTGAYGVQDAINNNIGPTMFALQTESDPSNPVTGGQSLSQIEAANKTNIWNTFNIDSLSAQMTDLQQSQVVLPKDMTDFIRDQDTYIQQTDQMISDYIAQNAGKAMSTQESAAYADHLNTLYTLRGAQNTKYINYMGSAVAMNDANLKTVTDQYTANLKNATDALTSANAMSKDQYDTYTTALTDMYTAVEKAPIAAQQYRLVEQQILTSHATMVSDAAKSGAQTDFITQSNLLNNPILGLVDKNSLVMPGIDLVQKVQDIVATNPTILPVNILMMYSSGVDNYLKAADEKAPTGTVQPNQVVVTSAGKVKVATDAITQYTRLMLLGQVAPGDAGYDANNPFMNNPNVANLGQTYAQNTAKEIGNTLSGSLLSTSTGTAAATGLMQAVKGLNPSAGLTNWFPKPQTAAQFTASVSSLTNGDASAVAAAPAIYSAYQQYLANGDTASGFVTAMLYNTVSTSSSSTPYTPLEFAQNVGGLYGNYLLSQASNIAMAGPGSTLSQ